MDRAVTVSTPSLDVLVVAYHTDLGMVERLVASLATQAACPFTLRVAFIDNSCDDAYHTALATRVEAWRGLAVFAGVELVRSPRNTGFGNAVNALLAITRGDFVLTVNPDAYLAPDALAVVFAAMHEAREQEHRVGGWEIRQTPYEHPKAYDPVSQHTRWISGAACIYRRSALAEVGGFEPRIFMYSEDVDLSWRLGARGWKLRYVPSAQCWHDSYRYVGEIKPVQAIEGCYTNLCLRARYGTWRDMLTGVGMILHEITQPPSFPRRSQRLIGALVRFLRNAVYFRRGPWRETLPFPAEFNHWDYGAMRLGDYYAFPAPGTPEPAPLVSIVVRTHDRWPQLREALTSLAQQTYRPIEVVIVEDGEPATRERIEAEFGGCLRLVYACTGERAGRSRAGNLGLSLARGEWLGFLDDDDALFADHVEVLVRAALKARREVGAVGVYGLAWEVPTDVLSRDPLRYRSAAPFTRYREPFSRAALWHHDFMPIQTVLFHRSCWERHGGFDEAMDQLEDWNLWTRYTAADDFVMVDKTTSIYRVPAAGDKAADRQAALDAAYADAVALQEGIAVSTDVGRLKRSHRQDLAHAKELRRQEIEAIEGPVWRRRWFVRIPIKAWRALGLPDLR
jgi:GT2 family glycosyltransferase